MDPHYDDPALREHQHMAERYPGQSQRPSQLQMAEEPPRADALGIPQSPQYGQVIGNRTSIPGSPKYDSGAYGSNEAGFPSGVVAREVHHERSHQGESDPQERPHDFSAVTDTYVRLSQAKCVLLGSVAAGKTSLLNALRYGESRLVPAGPDGRTIGIEVHSVAVRPDTKLWFYDFGGHDTYHFSQQLFLTQRAIYLIAVDISIYDQTKVEKTLRHWYSILTSRLVSPVICLLATHIDECEDREEMHRCCLEMSNMLKHMDEMHRLKLENEMSALKASIVEENSDPDVAVRRFQPRTLRQPMERLNLLLRNRPRIFPKVCCISSKTMEGMDNFREDLVTIVSDNESLFPQKDVPRPWIALADAIVSKKEDVPFVTINEFIELAQEFGVVGDYVQKALIYLQSVGLVLHYQDYRQNSELSQYVFVNPNLLLAIFGLVFNHNYFMDETRFVWKHKSILRLPHYDFVHLRKNLKERGVIGEQLLKCFWDAMGISDEVYQAIVPLLEKFDLCYEIRLKPGEAVVEGRHFLFPYLLNKKKPPEIKFMWSEDLLDNFMQCGVELNFTTPNLPFGFLEKVLVRAHTYVDHCLAWKQGMVAFCDEGQDLVRIEAKTDSQGNALLTISARVRVDRKSMARHIILLLVAVTNRVLLHHYPGVLAYWYCLCSHCIYKMHTQKYSDVYMDRFPADNIVYTAPGDPLQVRCINCKGGETLSLGEVFPITSADVNNLKRLMSEPCCRALKASETALLKYMNYRDVMNALLRKNLLTIKQAEAIGSKPNHEERTQQLLDYLPECDHKSFEVVCNELKQSEDSAWLAGELKVRAAGSNPKSQDDGGSGILRMSSSGWKGSQSSQGSQGARSISSGTTWSSYSRSSYGYTGSYIRRPYGSYIQRESAQDYSKRPRADYSVKIQNSDGLTNQTNAPGSSSSISPGRTQYVRPQDKIIFEPEKQLIQPTNKTRETSTPATEGHHEGSTHLPEQSISQLKGIEIPEPAVDFRQRDKIVHEVPAISQEIEITTTGIRKDAVEPPVQSSELVPPQDVTALAVESMIIQDLDQVKTKKKKVKKSEDPMKKKKKKRPKGMKSKSDKPLSELGNSSFPDQTVENKPMADVSEVRVNDEPDIPKEIPDESAEIVQDILTPVDNRESLEISNIVMPDVSREIAVESTIIVEELNTTIVHEKPKEISEIMVTEKGIPDEADLEVSMINKAGNSTPEPVPNVVNSLPLVVGTVESLETAPPRMQDLIAVESLETAPPRKQDLIVVESLETAPPRKQDLIAVESLETAPPRKQDLIAQANGNPLQSAENNRMDVPLPGKPPKAKKKRKKIPKNAKSETLVDNFKSIPNDTTLPSMPSRPEAMKEHREQKPPENLIGRPIPSQDTAPTIPPTSEWSPQGDEARRRILESRVKSTGDIADQITRERYPPGGPLAVQKDLPKMPKAQRDILRNKARSVADLIGAADLGPQHMLHEMDPIELPSWSIRRSRSSLSLSFRRAKSKSPRPENKEPERHTWAVPYNWEQHQSCENLNKIPGNNGNASRRQGSGIVVTSSASDILNQPNRSQSVSGPSRVQSQPALHGAPRRYSMPRPTRKDSNPSISHQPQTQAQPPEPFVAEFPDVRKPAAAAIQKRQPPPKEIAIPRPRPSGRPNGANGPAQPNPQHQYPLLDLQPVDPADPNFRNIQLARGHREFELKDSDSSEMTDSFHTGRSLSESDFFSDATLQSGTSGVTIDSYHTTRSHAPSIGSRALSHTSHISDRTVDSYHSVRSQAMNNSDFPDDATITSDISELTVDSFHTISSDITPVASPSRKLNEADFTIVTPMSNMTLDSFNKPLDDDDVTLTSGSSPEPFNVDGTPNRDKFLQRQQQEDSKPSVETRHLPSFARPMPPGGSSNRPPNHPPPPPPSQQYRGPPPPGQRIVMEENAPPVPPRKDLQEPPPLPVRPPNAAPQRPRVTFADDYDSNGEYKVIGAPMGSRVKEAITVPLPKTDPQWSPGVQSASAYPEIDPAPQEKEKKGKKVKSKKKKGEKKSKKTLLPYVGSTIPAQNQAEGDGSFTSDQLSESPARRNLNQDFENQRRPDMGIRMNNNGSGILHKDTVHDMVETVSREPRRLGPVDPQIFSIHAQQFMQTNMDNQQMRMDQGMASSGAKPHAYVQPYMHGLNAAWPQGANNNTNNGNSKDMFENRMVLVEQPYLPVRTEANANMPPGYNPGAAARYSDAPPMHYPQHQPRSMLGDNIRGGYVPRMGTQSPSRSDSFRREGHAGDRSSISSHDNSFTMGTTKSREETV